MTLEDILRERGMTLKKGVLGDEGDVEFWDEEDVKVHVGKDGNTGTTEADETKSRKKRKDTE